MDLNQSRIFNIYKNGENLHSTAVAQQLKKY